MTLNPPILEKITVDIMDLFQTLLWGHVSPASSLSPHAERLCRVCFQDTHHLPQLLKAAVRCGSIYTGKFKMT